MQNFDNTTFNLINLKKELPLGDLEQGELINSLLLGMIYPNGVSRPDVDDFQIVSSKWRNLIDKEDRTPEENEFLEKEFNEQIEIMAQSYFLFMLKEVKSPVAQIKYSQFESFMLKHRFAENNINGQIIYTPEEIEENIKNAFLLIACGGLVDKNDDIIDLDDIRIYIRALTMRVKTSEDQKKLKGFLINGLITPREYAVNEAFLFRKPQDNNMFLLKLEVANRTINNNWS